MKAKVNYINIVVSLVLGMFQGLQAQEPTVNYITPVGSNSASVYWAFHLDAPNQSLDSLTYVFSLENATSESAYYQEITVALEADSVLLNPGQIGTAPIYKYIYSSTHTLPLFDTYYTHTASYNGIVYDRMLGSGVNYYYDKLEYNQAYPKYNEVLTNPNGSHYHLYLDTDKFSSIEPAPDAFAYKTKVKGAPVQSMQTYTNAQQYAQYYWNTDVANPMIYQPSPMIYLENSESCATDEIVLSYPDTLIEHVWMYTWNVRHDEVLYYPVYDELICAGDEVMINGNPVSTPGLYIDSLTTTLGTDSLVGVRVAFKPTVYSETVFSEICEGDGYEFNNVEYTEAGEYEFTYGANCDSIQVLHLEVIHIPNQVEHVNDMLIYSTPENGYTYQWIDLSDNSPISGATSESFQPESDGLYALEISNGICKVQSEPIALALSVEEFGVELTLAPNPFSDYITLNLNETVNNLTIRISNAQAQTVLLENYSNTSQVVIQGNHLEAGIYFMTISNGQQHITKQIIRF